MIYLDTSAALKVIVAEAESPALLAYLSCSDEELVASWLLHSELHCAVARRPEAVDARLVAEVLDRVLLVDLARSDLLAAPAVGRGLRTLDALHLATALRVAADAMATYDHQLAQAALTAGLDVVQPA